MKRQLLETASALLCVGALVMSASPLCAAETDTQALTTQSS